MHGGGAAIVQKTVISSKEKLAVTVWLCSLVALMLPFMSIRETRVSADITYSLIAIGPLSSILAFCPMLLLSSVITERADRSDRLITLAGFFGLLAPVVLLGVRAPAMMNGSGPFARYSGASGFSVWLLCGFIILLMKERRSRADYVGIGICIAALGFFFLDGSFSQLGLVQEAKNFGTRLPREIVTHMRITGISIGISMIIGLPAALLSYQNMHVRKLIFPVLNILQTIPSIALFGLLIAPLAAIGRAFPQLRSWGIQGIGNTPAIIALSMYAIYPLIRYSYTAFSEIDAAVIQAAEGIGMSRRQLWRMVRIPLAAAGVLHGIRVALVQTIGNATLAKLIGGGGLGVFVFEGLGQASVDMVLLGMILIILLTAITDALAQAGIFLLTPRALRHTDNKTEPMG